MEVFSVLSRMLDLEVGCGVQCFSKDIVLQSVVRSLHQLLWTGPHPFTLTETVASSIRKAILRGGVLPGDPLHEAARSDFLQVSLGTVREALRELQYDGLIEIQRHRGEFVTGL